jgi:hypothetical protein
LKCGYGRVAQLVEQGIENPRVGGSTPSLATTLLLLTLTVLVACGDRCERLCDEVADAVAVCRPDGLSWADLGATSRRSYALECKRDWDETSAALGSRDLELSLDVCEDAQDELAALSCDEIIALYAE